MDATHSDTAGITLGSTLYSFTNEFHSRRYDLEGLVREVAARNLGPGIEIVGFQSVRGFPVVTDAFADWFKGLIAETGLTPTCLAINADALIDRNRPMTFDESVAYHARQIEAAAKLGFPVARFQYAATPEVVAKLAPLAEKLDVRLGLEIHAPHSIDHPDVIAYRETYERVGSPYLGFIPDFGASARSVPPAYKDYFKWRGIDQGMVDHALEIWEEQMEPFKRRAKFLDWAKAKGHDEVHAVDVSIIFGLFSRQPLTNWLEIMPQTVHIHGKFYGVDETTGEDPSIDYEAILPIFVAGGYRGSISSEWEGHQVSDDNGFEKVAAHLAMERRILQRAVQPV
ncbi:sugar phosphate isomerase/epimerase family protein [Sphingomonas sp.]|uniref:sugar phosphate isomerase/epimerase family protein n=1 Tax=Sphingomonas sp. TaxID=28214 RepID=UPI003BAB78FB